MKSTFVSLNATDFTSVTLRVILSRVNVIDIQKARLCRSVKRDCGQEPEDEVKVRIPSAVWMVILSE